MGAIQDNWNKYNVKFTSEPPPKMTWSEIKAELASLPEPTFCIDCYPNGLLGDGEPCPKHPPKTICIDCGQPTTPGKGSARCPSCWQDRLGPYTESEL